MPALEIEDFREKNKAKEWGENWARQWIDHDLTFEEKEAIEDFLNSHIQINQYLQGFNGQLLKERPKNMDLIEWNAAREFNELIEEIDKAIEKSLLPQTIYVYKTIDEQYFDQEFNDESLINDDGQINIETVTLLKKFFEHKTIQDPRFMFGSILRPVNFRHPILLKITVPRHTHAGFIGEKIWPWGPESYNAEIIVKRNQTLRFDHFAIGAKPDGTHFLKIDASFHSNH